MKKTNVEPLHLRILKDVQNNILSGKWQPGFNIPFETDMAAHYNCSRMTVNKALTQLTKSGLLERRRKSGTFVKSPQSLSAALEITTIQSEVEKLNQSYAYQLLSDKQRPLKIADQRYLDIATGKNIREISCLHLANNKPFCFEQRLINIGAVPEISGVKFSDEAPGAWLLKKVPWSRANHQIFAVAANELMAQNLKINIGDPCLVIERITQNAAEKITWAKLSYSGDLHSLQATFTP